MATFLIWYRIPENHDRWDYESGYATIEANNKQQALQLAIAWIPGISELEVRGEIKRKITNNQGLWSYRMFFKKVEEKK